MCRPNSSLRSRSRFTIHMLLIAHPAWHWLRPSTIQLVVPKGITAAELQKTMHKITFKGSGAVKNKERAEKVCAEKKEYMAAKNNAKDMLIAQLYDTYGEGDRSLGPWDAGENLKRWDKRDRKEKTKAATSLTKATREYEHAVVMVAKREEELERANLWDKRIAKKPEVVLIERPLRDTDLAYVIYPPAPSGDGQLFYMIVQQRLRSKMRITRGREVGMGIEMETKTPNPALAAKLTELEKEVTDLGTFVASGIADQARLDLAKRILEVAEGGRRIKYSSGVKNHPFPSPLDINNVHAMTSCAYGFSPNQAPNKMRFDVNSVVGVQKSPNDIEWWSGVVVAARRPKNASSDSAENIRGLDVVLQDGSMKENVRPEDCRRMTNLFIISEGSSKSFFESAGKSLAIAQRKHFEKTEYAAKMEGRIKTLERTVEKDLGKVDLQTGSVTTLLAIAAGKAKDREAYPQCPVCLDDLGTGCTEIEDEVSEATS